MSTVVVNKLPGADFSEYGMGRKLPAADRCLGWYEFGLDERRSRRNHALAGTRGHFAAAYSIATAGFSGGYFITEVPNDVLSGDCTVMAFFKPGSTGSDLSPAFLAGGNSGANQQTFESAPTRYSACIQQRVFTSAPYDVVPQMGTYDSTSPSSAGTNNGVSRLLAGSAQPVCAISEFVASTRVHTVTVRNGGAFAIPSTASATAAANHIRDTRTTLPFEVTPKDGTGSIAYSFMVFNGVLTQAEKNAVYALENTRLTALGVSGL
jgi:hypothetical protein